MSRPSLKRIHGQRSFEIETDLVSLAVTELGGQMAPVRFFRNTKMPFEPYAIAPWAEEKHPRDLPRVLSVLRGDFFCLPFGGNDAPWRGEKHPPHGETANAVWTFDDHRKTEAGSTLALSMRTVIRSGVIRKRIALLNGETNIYCRHVIEGMKGPMSVGHHATLRFPDRPGSGLISLSPFRYGQVYPGRLEKPEEKGYSILAPGSRFTRLDRVKRMDGTHADLTLYPARRGYEDLVMVCARPSVFPAWAAVVFPIERYLWFALKDPRVLASTVLWHDNGGRHYPPWNGRSLNTMGIEDVTAHFHDGLAESAGRNPLKEKGLPTDIRLSPARPFAVNYIQGAARVPRGFGHLRQVKPVDDQTILIQDDAGREMQHRVRWTFLRSGALGAAELDKPVA